MKIHAIEIGTLNLSLKKPFKTALRTVRESTEIVVKLISDHGALGFGSAPPSAAVTGDTEGSVIAAIRDTLGPRILGMEISALEDILQNIEKGIVRNTSAKAALDIAAHDLWARCYGIPLYRLFGGLRQTLETDLTISLNTPDEMVQDAQDAVSRGFRALKIKVGNDASLDFERVKAIDEAVGKSIALRLDANQGWKPKEAVRLIHAFEDAGFNIVWIEQPCRAHDYAGLKYVSTHVDTDIMADESAFSPEDVFKLLSMECCDLINIKLMKAGGLHRAQKIAHLAEAAGITCMMGCMLESKIGVSAAASLAGGRSNIIAYDLDAPLLLSADPVNGGVTFNQNQIILPESPGLGITALTGFQHHATLSR